MKRFMPKSLAGQMIALTLLAIVVAQMIGFAIFADERRFALQSAAHQQVMTHTTSVVRMLALTPNSYHDEIIKGANSENFHLSLGTKATVYRSKRQRSEIMLQRHLHEMLVQDVEKVRVRLHRDYRGWVRSKVWKGEWDKYSDDDWEDEDDRDDVKDEEGDDFLFDSFGHGDSKFDHFKKTGFLQELSISVKLKSGKWLNIESLVAPPSPLWALPSLMAMLVTAVALIIIVIVMMRRVTKPMANLALAAEKLGRGDGVDKLPSVGPQDVRRATDAFNIMQERLDRFVKGRTRMLAAISHDLRTPITSLRIRAEFIEDPELQEKMLATLDEMQRMTEATLAFAKEDAGSEESIYTNLYALLDSIVSDFTDMGVDADITGDKDIVMLCRPLSLKRALRNLVENAVKYGDKALVSVQRNNSSIVVEVSDDGPGVPENRLDQIFEPFYRQDEARDTKSGSVGLGLSIARSVIHAHGGTIVAKNKEPQGLIVKIEFPEFS